MIIFCGGNSPNLGKYCYELCVFLLSQDENLSIKATDCKVAEEIDTYLKILGNTTSTVIIQYSSLSDLALEKIHNGFALSVYLYEDPREILSDVNPKMSFTQKFLKIWRVGEDNWLPPLDAEGAVRPRTLVIQQKNLSLDMKTEIKKLAEYLGVEIPNKLYTSQKHLETVKKQDLTWEQRLLVLLQKFLRDF